MWGMTLRPWQTRTHCCGHIVAHNVSWERKHAGHKMSVVLLCCETFVTDTKCFWTKSETFFVPRTQNLCPQQMLRARANGAIMFPRQCVLVCQGLKAMLHEAIVLATCNATMTNKEPFKLHRVCHTCAIFFATCNAYNNKKDGGRAKSSTSCKRWALNGAFWQNCVASCWGDVTRNNLSRNVAKSRRTFYFSCNLQRNNCSCKMGCYTWIFSCNWQCNKCCVASCKKNCLV